MLKKNNKCEKIKKISKEQIKHYADRTQSEFDACIVEQMTEEELKNHHIIFEGFDDDDDDDDDEYEYEEN